MPLPPASDFRDPHFFTSALATIREEFDDLHRHSFLTVLIVVASFFGFLAVTQIGLALANGGRTRREHRHVE